MLSCFLVDQSVLLVEHFFYKNKDIKGNNICLFYGVKLRACLKVFSISQMYILMHKCAKHIQTEMCVEIQRFIGDMVEVASSCYHAS